MWAGSDFEYEETASTSSLSSCTFVTCRQPPAGQEQPRAEQGLHGLSMAPHLGPGNLRALSKVSEEASSLEKQSSDETSSANMAKGPGLVTDQDGRQSTSMVLGNIHEQVCKESQWCT